MVLHFYTFNNSIIWYIQQIYQNIDGNLYVGGRLVTKEISNQYFLQSYADIVVQIFGKIL